MRSTFIALALGGIILCAGSSGICGNLEDARRSADDAYDYSGRAANSNDLYRAQYYSRQTVSAAEDARDSAMSARASDAAGHEAKAYDYSGRASRAQSVRDAQHYSRLAEKSAADAQSSIDYSIAKSKADEAAKDAKEQERIKSELAKKAAEAVIADMQPIADNDTETDNKTVESTITGTFGR